MASDINKVRHVREVDSIMGGPNINSFLAIKGWILLNSTTQSATGDSGPYSWPVCQVGWIGEGEPQIPSA